MPISLNHPGLLRVLHVGRDDPERYFFYVMEIADDITSGQTIDPATYKPRSLASEIRQRSRLSLTECVELGLALSDALEYLHQQQLIHRDLKPANVIYVQGAPKIADIGLVTDIVGTQTNATWVGTMGYLAPEGPGKAEADLYSLGKVIYQAWTGLSPERFPELPADLLATPADGLVVTMNRILLRACECNPKQRYQQAAQVHNELAELARTDTFSNG